MAAADKKITYTAADVAVLEETILKQKAEIEEMKRRIVRIPRQRNPPKRRLLSKPMPARRKEPLTSWQRTFL